jgi:hypothetical protein
MHQRLAVFDDADFFGGATGEVYDTSLDKSASVVNTHDDGLFRFEVRHTKNRPKG